MTSRATSVGGIVLVHGEDVLARVLERVYAAMDLPFRPGSVGRLRRAGSHAGVEETIEAFAAEAELRYGAERVPLDEKTLRGPPGATGDGTRSSRRGSEAGDPRSRFARKTQNLKE